MLDVGKIFHASKVDEFVEDRIWLITSSKQKQCLKNVTPANDIIGLAQVSQGIRISQKFFEYGIPAVLPIETLTGHYICQQQNHELLLFPWQEGRALSIREITPAHGYEVGKLLGKLHQAKLNLDKIFDSPWYLFTEYHWQPLLEKSQSQNFKQLLPELNEWTHQYHQAIKYFSQDKVISHGDLFPANMIWNENLNYSIIDWDSAGWIHTEIELFGIALNWAGIVEQDFNSEIFASVYAGYESVTQKKFKPNEQLIWASLGSWLKWLKLNIELSLKTSQTRFEDEVKRTLKALYFLTSPFL